MSNELKYIDYINAFNNWCYDHYLNKDVQIVFFKVLHIMNLNKWEEWVEISNDRLRDFSGLSNEKTFIRCRDKLIELGFIEYQKGKKGQPNRYRLVKEFFIKQKEKYTYKFTGTNDSTNYSINDSKSDSKSDSTSDSHIKSKDIDIDIKESISKDIPKKSDVDCKNSNNQKTHAAKNDIHSLIDNYTENKELRLELKEYLEMRKAKKVPNTKRAIQLNLDKLSNLADNDEKKIAIVQKTIEHGWTSFFPNSEGKSGAYSNTKQQELSVEDKLKKIKSSYGDVCDLYNTVCSNLPKTNRMSQKRITRLYTLLRSGYSREDIRKVFEIANTSKFLCGKTKNSDFTANLDWLIVKENFEKVLEGNYKSETAENTKASNPKQGRKPSYDISNHVKYCEDLLFRAKSP